MRGSGTKRKAPRFKIVPFLFSGLCRIRRLPQKKSRRPARGRRQTKLEPEKPLKPLPHSFKGECGASRLAARSASFIDYTRFVVVLQAFFRIFRFFSTSNKKTAFVLAISYTSAHRKCILFTSKMNYSHFYGFLIDELHTIGRAEETPDPYSSRRGACFRLLFFCIILVRRGRKLFSPQNSRTVRARIFRSRRAAFPPA